MLHNNSKRVKRFYENRPIVEIYKGYEIRKFNDMYEVIASVGIYGISSDYIDGCREFIDKLVKFGIKQNDNEEISKFIFHVKPYDKINL